jgi:hypothetical protein
MLQWTPRARSEEFLCCCCPVLPALYTAAAVLFLPAEPQTSHKSRKLMRLGAMWAQQETSAAIERAVMSGADPATTQAATWVGSSTARAVSGRNRWGGWWDRK